MLRNTLCYSLLGFLLVFYIASDLQAGTVKPSAARILRHYPVAGAVEVPCVTGIGITASKPFDASAISALHWQVIGSRTGVHAGNIVLSDNLCTVIFKPLLPFGNGETVSIVLSSSSEDGTQLECSFNFVTCVRTPKSYTTSLLLGNHGITPAPDNSPDPLDSLPPPPDTVPPPPDTVRLPPPDTNHVVRPPPPDSLRPPPPDTLHAPPSNQWGLTTLVDNNPTPGLVFLSIAGGGMPGILLISDEHSNVLSEFPFPFPAVATDFIRQPNGLMTFFGANNLYYGIDTLGNLLNTYGCTDSVVTDGHELIVANDGGYTLLGQSRSSQNLSLVGGIDSAIILGGVIQTFDASGNLIFQWRGIDHYNVADDVEPGDIAATEIDFEHANSIDIDSDGNYILSNRNLSEITKIDGSTADIIWRFGGSHNQFKLVGDTLGISCQHYAKWLKNGDILLFDNGVYHATPASRAVEYFLDTINMTATLKWQYRPDPPIFSSVEGNAERLDNGNTFIGWGATTSVSATEVDPSGKVVYEMLLPQNIFSYRAIKYPYAAPATVTSSEPQISGLSLSVSPSANGYDVNMAAHSSTVASISLCDAAGRVVQHIFNGNISPQNQHISIPTASLPTGVYFCLLSSPQGNLVRPLTVLR